jgi:hypothetical protein
MFILCTFIATLLDSEDVEKEECSITFQEKQDTTEKNASMTLAEILTMQFRTTEDVMTNRK